MHKISGIRKTFYLRSHFLAFAWILGLLAGVHLLCETSFASLMCSVVFARTSIIGLVISLVFPFLLSYILMRCLNFCYILLFAFLKAVSFMYCYGSVMIAYGNAGWLVSAMLLFSDFFLVVLLLQIWFHASFGQSYSPRVFAISYVPALLTIGCFDYFVVSPYVSILLNR